MTVSARNTFRGTISALKSGPINAEVELTTGGGDRLVAIVTQASVESLGLAVGKPAVALVKAPWVILVSADEPMKFTARNCLPGKVSALTKGAVNTEVELVLPGGSKVYAIVTNDAARELRLQEGSAVSALIKASHVVLGVPA